MRKVVVISLLLFASSAAFAANLDEKIAAANQSREKQIGAVMNLFEVDQFDRAVASVGMDKQSVEAALRSMSPEDLATVAQSSQQVTNMASVSVDRSDVNLLLIVLIIVAIVAIIAIAAS